MEAKKLLTIENIVLLGGIGFLAYLFLRKPKGVININPKMEGTSMGRNTPNKQEAKTIVLDLRDKNRGAMFPKSMAKSYDSREIKTFAPARTVITDY